MRTISSENIVFETEQEYLDVLGKVDDLKALKDKLQAEYNSKVAAFRKATKELAKELDHISNTLDAVDRHTELYQGHPIAVWNRSWKTDGYDSIHVSSPVNEIKRSVGYVDMLDGEPEVTFYDGTRYPPDKHQGSSKAHAYMYFPGDEAFLAIAKEYVVYGTLPNDAWINEE